MDTVDISALLTVNNLIKSNYNGNTVTIGSQNTSYCHFINSADIPFYFNKAIYVAGDLVSYNGAGNLGSLSQRWPYLYAGVGNFSGAVYASDLYSEYSLKLSCGSNGYKLGLHTDGTHYYLGYGFPDIGGDTLIYGNNLKFYYGASRTLGMSLNSVGDMDIDDIAYHRITRGAIHHEFIGNDADCGVMKIIHNSTEGSGSPGEFSASLAIFDERAATISGTYQPTFFINREGATRIPDLMGVNVGGSRVFTIDSNGAVSLSSTLTVGSTVGALAFFQTSDERLKTDIKTITSPVNNTNNSVIDELRPVEFKWKESKTKAAGFIAQEVKGITALSNIVGESPNGYLNIDYSQIIPYLVSEIQSLKNRVKKLENK